MRQGKLNLIIDGYLAFFKKSLQLLLFLGFIAVTALAVSFPLWFWATSHSSSFRIATLLFLSVAILWVLGKNSMNTYRSLRSRGISALGSLWRPIYLLFRAVLTFTLLYITLYLFARGVILWAFLSALLALLLLGFLFFHKK